MSRELFKLSFPERESYEYLIKSVFTSGAFNPTPRISSAGIELPCFVDMSVPLKNPKFLRIAAKEFKEIIEKESLYFAAFCAVIRGGIPLAQSLSRELEVPWIARLGLKIDQERQNLVEGNLPLGLQVIIVDDVETTGLNATLAYCQLEGEGLASRNVLYIMSYGIELAKRNLAKDGLVSHHLFTINDLLSVGLRNNFIKREVVLRINDWQQNFNS